MKYYIQQSIIHVNIPLHYLIMLTRHVLYILGSKSWGNNKWTFVGELNACAGLELNLLRNATFRSVV
jgi:hypothetical protein